MSTLTNKNAKVRTKSLLGSSLLIGLMTLFSRISGLIRDQVIAYYFGAGAATDAFNVAFRIPNLFRRFFGEGSLNQAFIPVLSDYKLNASQAALKQFIAQVMGSLMVILLIISGLGIWFSSEIITIFASGFVENPEKFELSVRLLQVMFPYVFFICLTALMAGILNTVGHFMVPAITPILLNISMVGFALVNVYFSPPVMSLALGVFLAGILQFMLLLVFVARSGLLSFPRWGFQALGVQKVMWLMLPAIIGSSSSQINLLVNTWLASKLQTGSITWLYYSDRLVEFVIGSVAVAIATVVLPHLSKLYVNKDEQEYAKTINWSFTMALVIGLPSTLGLIFMAKPLISVLFMRGAFSFSDVVMTSQSLTTYALSICAFFIIKVFAPVYYSRQDTKTPVKFSLCSIGLNILLQFILVRYFAHAGLALSASIAAWLNAVLLLIGLKYYQIHAISSLFSRPLLALIPANIGLGSFLYWAQSYGQFWVESAILWRLMALFFVVFVSIVFYFGALHVCGFHLRHLKSPKAFSG